MENNTAFIAKISNIRPIEGADKIVVADVQLNNITITQVVVGKNDFVDSALVVYLDSNLCLNQKIIDDYPILGTYLAKAGRIRCIKLRGQISNGLAIEVQKFYKYFNSEKEAIATLVEGYSFTKLNAIEVCYKYMPPVKIMNQCSNKGKKAQKKMFKKLIENQFHFHFDTQMLLRNIHKINPYQIASISRKIHGSSFIVSNCLVYRKLSFIENVLKKLGILIINTHYDYLYASRTVIKNEATSSGFYKEDIWTLIGKEYFYGKLHEGETIYGEIVGYLPSGGFIQKDYDYGCIPGQHKIAVYRITKTGNDGNVVEYSWQMMKERCIELNVSMVEEYYYGYLKDKYPAIAIDEDWNKNFVAQLAIDYLEKDSKDNLCKKVPDEGVVVRLEGLSIESYKLKSERFYLKENENIDKGEIDTEAEEGIANV
jgi:hypothetical protein